MNNNNIKSVLLGLLLIPVIFHVISVVHIFTIKGNFTYLFHGELKYTNVEWCEPKLAGHIHVNTSRDRPYPELLKSYPDVTKGGHWKPNSCKPRHEVTIVVPFRDREHHIRIFLDNMHSLLQKQMSEYRIVVVRQIENQTFNRGKLSNVGFVEARRLYGGKCFIFHDVDLLPVNDKNMYTCEDQPKHLPTAIDKFKFRLPYNTIFGGVQALTADHMNRTNGFSNSYWGWGGEDDDMSSRLKLAALGRVRNSNDISAYKMIKHPRDKGNPINEQRRRLMKMTSLRWRTDGLNSLSYELLKVVETPLYTRLEVDLLESESKAELESELKALEQSQSTAAVSTTPPALYKSKAKNKRKSKKKNIA